MLEKVKDRPITLLNLKNNEGLGEGGAKGFNDYLETNTSLLELNLENTGLSDDSWDLLSKAVKANKGIDIRKLNVKKCIISEKGNAKFCDFILKMP